MGRILVVDDEETAREELGEALRDAGHTVTGVGDAEAARRCLERESFDVCISDIRLPGADGISLLREIKAQSPGTAVLLITAYGELRTSVEALRLGAVDYIIKPVLFDDILVKVAAAIEHRSLSLEVAALRRRLAVGRGSTRLVGDCPAMRDLKGLVTRLAACDCNVLITGESGTGKELVAQSIHAAGRHAGEPFVAVNCGAISPGLLESELFGHVEGAFTGATETKEGLFTAAREGTLFLDEIGDMPLALQVKILRAVDAREVQPVGSVHRIPVRARLIAATNRDLPAEVRAKRFREDLFYRLSVVEVHCPPLRERQDDLPQLVSHLLARLNGELRMTFVGVAPEAMRRLKAYAWPGNVRELANVLERAMLVAKDHQLIGVEDLPLAIQDAGEDELDLGVDLRAATRRFELRYIERMIRACDGDKREAARHLGIGLSSLYRKQEAGERPSPSLAPSPTPGASPPAPPPSPDDPSP